MQVETYEVEESGQEAALLAADSDALELIEKLGLDGQKRFANAETVTRFPYRKLTKEECLVYGLLCPLKTALENYSEGIIPIRVLQVASHAKETDFLDHLLVWHPENADIKDPVLIGTKKVKTGPGEYQYTYEQYFLARWGTVLPSFDEMKALAKKMWIQSTKSKLAKVAAEVRSAVEALDEVNGTDALPDLSSSPHFHFSAF